MIKMQNLRPIFDQISSYHRLLHVFTSTGKARPCCLRHVYGTNQHQLSFGCELYHTCFCVFCLARAAAIYTKFAAENSQYRYIITFCSTLRPFRKPSPRTDPSSSQQGNSTCRQGRGTGEEQGINHIQLCLAGWYISYNNVSCIASGRLKGHC